MKLSAYLFLLACVLTACVSCSDSGTVAQSYRIQMYAFQVKDRDSITLPQIDAIKDYMVARSKGLPGSEFEQRFEELGIELRYGLSGSNEVSARDPAKLGQEFLWPDDQSVLITASVGTSAKSNLFDVHLQHKMHPLKQPENEVLRAEKAALAALDVPDLVAFKSGLIVAWIITTS